MLQFLGRDAAAGSNDHVQMANDYQIVRLKACATVATARTLRNVSCARKEDKNTFAATPNWDDCNF